MSAGSSNKDVLILESLAIGLVGTSVIFIVLEIINRNKPEKSTQEEKLSAFGIGFLTAVSAHFLLNKFIKK